jgi:hypothetical protein
MEEGAPGLLTGVVEADETYIGGVYDKRRKRERHQTQPVFGAIQRSKDGESSKVRSFRVKTAGSKVLTAAVKNAVSTEAELFITNEWAGYKTVGKQYHHETVNQIKLEYVRKGDPRSIHTNSIENFWSLFNRGVVGSFHKVSVKHLSRYLDEFTFRFNNRKAEDLFALVMLNLVMATGINYADLVKNEEEPKNDGPEPYSGPRSSYEPW